MFTHFSMYVINIVMTKRFDKSERRKYGILFVMDVTNLLHLMWLHLVATLPMIIIINNVVCMLLSSAAPSNFSVIMLVSKMVLTYTIVLSWYHWSNAASLVLPPFRIIFQNYKG